MENSNPKTVLFVHLKIADVSQDVRIRRPDQMEINLGLAEVSITDAFAGAPPGIHQRFDRQSFFVEQDAGFPYLLKLFADSRNIGLDLVISEVGQSGVTLFRGDEKLESWLVGHGVRFRVVKVSAWAVARPSAGLNP